LTATAGQPIHIASTRNSCPGDNKIYLPDLPPTVAVVDPLRVLVHWQVTAANKVMAPDGPMASTVWRVAGRSRSTGSMRAGRA